MAIDEADERVAKVEIAAALIEAQGDGASVHTNNRILFWLRWFATQTTEYGFGSYESEKFDALYTAVMVALPHWGSAYKDVEAILNSMFVKGEN
jgi:hypothetical protein